MSRGFTSMHAQTRFICLKTVPLSSDEAIAEGNSILT